jgi:hypothetical protein
VFLRIKNPKAAYLVFWFRVSQEAAVCDRHSCLKDGGSDPGWLMHKTVGRKPLNSSLNVTERLRSSPCGLLHMVAWVSLQQGKPEESRRQPEYLS